MQISYGLQDDDFVFFAVYTSRDYQFEQVVLNSDGKPNTTSSSARRSRVSKIHQTSISKSSALHIHPMLVRFRELASKSPEALRILGLAKFMWLKEVTSS